MQSFRLSVRRGLTPFRWLWRWWAQRWPPKSNSGCSTNARVCGSPNSRAFQSFLGDRPSFGPRGGWSGDQLLDACRKRPSGDARDLFSRICGFASSSGPNQISPEHERRLGCGTLRMAHRGAVIATAACDSGKPILARFGRTVAEAHAGPESDMARRAKVGFCSCCTRVRALPCLHGAILVNSAGSGTADSPCGRLMAGGPRGVRRPANMQRILGILGELGLVAQSLAITVPEPLVSATPPGDPPHVHGIEPIAKSQPDSALRDVFFFGRKNVT